MMSVLCPVLHNLVINKTADDCSCGLANMMAPHLHDPVLCCQKLGTEGSARPLIELCADMRGFIGIGPAWGS